jgi:hypothetical protein
MIRIKTFTALTLISFASLAPDVMAQPSPATCAAPPGYRYLPAGAPYQVGHVPPPVVAPQAPMPDPIPMLPVPAQEQQSPVAYQGSGYSSQYVAVRAGLFGRKVRWVSVQACQVPTTPYSQVPVASQPTPQAVAVATNNDDPYGFVSWLNGVRARYGLGAVVHDPNLSAWAVQNSRAGFGHSVRFGRRQNAGLGDLWTICPMWLDHPPHADALLDPTITHVGIGCAANVWTFEGN